MLDGRISACDQSCTRKLDLLAILAASEGNGHLDGFFQFELFHVERLRIQVGCEPENFFF